MSDPTPSQRHALLTLPERYPLERIDRLWIFPPHVGKTKETGLFVLGLTLAEGAPEHVRELHTVRYEAEVAKPRVKPVVQVAEEGRTSLDRIERVIAGVLARAGDDLGEPQLVPLEGRDAAWTDLLGTWGIELDASRR